jgi:hypothetical protein
MTVWILSVHYTDTGKTGVLGVYTSVDAASDACHKECGAYLRNEVGTRYAVTDPHFNWLRYVATKHEVLSA